jgi:hypothetical protein
MFQSLNPTLFIENTKTQLICYVWTNLYPVQCSCITYAADTNKQGINNSTKFVGRVKIRTTGSLTDVCFSISPLESADCVHWITCRFERYFIVRNYVYTFYETFLISILICDTVVLLRWIILHIIYLWMSLISLGMCQLYLRHYVFTQGRKK